MPTDFKLPELGENVTAGDVVRVLVAPGDTIEKDQPVLELETDKATIEVPSSVAGKVKDVRVKQGERIKVGQVVLSVEDGAAGQAPKETDTKDTGTKDTDTKDTDTKDTDTKDTTDTKATEARKEEPKGAEAKGAGPKSAESDSRAEAADGEATPTPQPADAPDEEGSSQAAPGQASASDRGSKNGSRRGEEERGTGRADQPEAQQADVEGAAKPKRGEVVDISRGARSAPPAAAPAASSAEGTGAEGGVPAPAAPSVRRLARELGVEIRRLTGTGPGGRISEEDVQAFVRGAMSGGGAAGPAAPLPDFSKWGEVERKPMSNIRRKTAEHLTHAWTAIPHVTQHDKADMTALEELRKRYGPQAEQAGGKLTVTVVALKIIAAALGRFPQFNASADMARGEIVYKKSIHVGIAADTPRGLLVPVIRDVDQKGIVELSAELAKASEKARAGKLSLDDMQGGGFTITNLGGIGGTFFTPIVNWPQVAILGISRGVQEPVYDGQNLQPRLMLPLSLSYDHRVIDGADAARFLRWVAEAFEQPFVLAL
jgi:pyruvate dehydrogenase E2 component (dihydrolipoamide acetyltransferase)